MMLALCVGMLFASLRSQDYIYERLDADAHTLLSSLGYESHIFYHQGTLSSPLGESRLRLVFSGLHDGVHQIVLSHAWAVNRYISPSVLSEWVKTRPGIKVEFWSKLDRLVIARTTITYDGSTQEQLRKSLGEFFATGKAFENEIAWYMKPRSLKPDEPVGMPPIDDDVLVGFLAADDIYSLMNIGGKEYAIGPAPVSYISVRGNLYNVQSNPGFENRYGFSTIDRYFKLSPEPPWPAVTRIPSSINALKKKITVGEISWSPDMKHIGYRAYFKFTHPVTVGYIRWFIETFTRNAEKINDELKRPSNTNGNTER